MVIGIDASRAVTNLRTGTEAYAFFLIQALIPLAEKAGHHTRLYFNQPPPPDLFSFSPQTTAVSLPFPRLWTHLRLARELHTNPPDVFFTPAHVIPLTYRSTAVATIHDLGYHHFPHAHTRQQVAYLKWSTRHNARRSHTVLADSIATQRDLHHFYGTDPAKVAVVYPGINPDLHAVTDAQTITAVCQKYAIVAPYLLYLGTLQPRKNLVRLIDAYVASGVPQQLVLAGNPGWMADDIVQKAANLPNVHLPGYIAEADKAALLSGATAVLYPSLYEGFGFPVLEAQACQTAVLCANTSSLPEVAADSTLLVDPLDTAALTAAIRTIASDASLRQELIQKGLVNVRRFTWATAARQTLHLLEQATLRK